MLKEIDPSSINGRRISNLKAKVPGSTLDSIDNDSV